MGRDPAAAVERLQMRQQPTGQDLLAVHSESQACHRDTDLGSRDVQVLPSRLREDVGHTLGQRAPLRGLMLDRRAGCPDDGELGRDEQAVGNDQHEDHADWDEDLCHALSSGVSGATRRTRTDTTARSATRSTSNS